MLFTDVLCSLLFASNPVVFILILLTIRFIYVFWVDCLMCLLVGFELCFV